MKKITLACLAIFVLLHSHAQKVSVDDLKGMWVNTNAADSSINFPWYDVSFIDSEHVNFIITGIVFANLTYHIDTTGNITRLSIRGKTAMGTKFSDVWLVKKQDVDTLKFQSLIFLSIAAHKNVVNYWESPETIQNTGVLVRRKE